MKEASAVFPNLVYNMGHCLHHGVNDPQHVAAMQHSAMEAFNTVKGATGRKEDGQMVVSAIEAMVNSVSACHSRSLLAWDIIEG